jgi:hypothetical protein
MSDVELDEAREERITMEAVVDAYGEDEQAMGWYYYLDVATCNTNHSGLQSSQN